MPPTFADVEAAAARLAGQAVLTPLLPVQSLSEELRAKIYVKPEVLQRTGSFKFRGAFNKLSQLTEEQMQRGVVAYSSGNHAQGVAAAARLLGIPATIVMPADAPRIKLENTRNYGAEVVTYDRYHEEREQVAAPLVAAGRTLVRPYDDPAIMAGQGTVGLEIAQQAKALGLKVDRVIVPCGGGGLTAGIATAMTALLPNAKLNTAEPRDFDDTARSLKVGERVGNDPNARSICDALLAATPGELTFAVNRKRVEAGLVADDREVGRAMAYAFNRLKLVVEPGGAIALAALLAGRVKVTGETVVVVLSGGNVDAATFEKVLSQS
ncbi:MAG TPA: threonine/serine dehydratase [Kiloniellales bacterium]|nr:threonine/serine dehydratase [Kiloniellales bacterium]